MESGMVSTDRKQELQRVYESLNPAELKRIIDAKLAKLQKAYDAKKSPRREVDPQELSVSALIIQPEAVRCHS